MRKGRNMEPEELKKLVSHGESQELEFKFRLPRAKDLAIIISAFANANGGRIIVGVQDDATIAGLADTDPTRIEQALRAISPPIEVKTETVIVDDKSVLVITVPSGDLPPYFATGRVFQRTGHMIRPVTAQALYSNITERATSSDALRAEVKRLSEAIETFNNELIVAQSWKKKIPDMVIGGIIGAAISSIISLAF